MTLKFTPRNFPGFSLDMPAFTVGDTGGNGAHLHHVGGVVKVFATGSLSCSLARDFIVGAEGAGLVVLHKERVGT